MTKERDVREETHRLIRALVQAENAMSLGEFVEQTGLSVEQAAQGVDTLVAIRVFEADYCLHRSDIGEIVYTFAANEQAQDVYEAFKEQS